MRKKESLDTPVRRKKPIELINAFSAFQGDRVLIDLPLRTVSEANCFEPWRKKHQRHREQQRMVALYLNRLKSVITLPCRIMLTRFAPHELDAFDNLPASFKYIVDAVCSIITGVYTAGKADSDKRISINCTQVKSTKYGIRIEITNEKELNKENL